MAVGGVERYTAVVSYEEFPGITCALADGTDSGTERGQWKARICGKASSG